MPRSLKRNWKKSLDTVEEGESSGGEGDNGSDSLDSDQGFICFILMDVEYTWIL